MSRYSEITAYLEQEKNELNVKFPKNEKTTILLFKKLYEFMETDFAELSDNRVYRLFLISFKEIICFAFEEDVSKSYLRHFFQSLNNEVIIGYLVKFAKKKEKDIRFIMKRFLNLFTATWQGYNDDKNMVLEEIIN